MYDLDYVLFFFFFKQKTAYEMRISDWSSDVCSSDLRRLGSGRNREIVGRHLAARHQRNPLWGRQGQADRADRAADRRQEAPDPRGCPRRKRRGSAHHTRAQEPQRRSRCAEGKPVPADRPRSEEQTSELQSLMRISYAVSCWKNKNIATPKIVA